MATLLALTAIGLLPAGAIAAIVGVVSVAIRQEEKNLTLTGEATGTVARAVRWLNGVYVRAPSRGPADVRAADAPAMTTLPNTLQPGSAAPASAPSARPPGPPRAAPA